MNQKESAMEKDIEKYLKHKIDAMHGLYLKFVSPGHAGVPDRIILIDGRIVFVELKASEKLRPRPQQQAMFENFRKHGFNVEVIGSKEQADRFCDWLSVSLKDRRA